MGLLGALSLHTYHNICVGPQTNAFPHATSPARFIGVRKTPSPDSLDPSPARPLCCPRVHHSIWLAMCHAHASIQEQRHKKRNCHATNCHAPTATHQLPRTNCHAPTAKHQLPSTNCHAPTARHQLPRTNCHAPTATHARQPGAVHSINSPDRSNLVSRQRPAGFQEWLMSWPWTLT